MWTVSLAWTAGLIILCLTARPPVPLLAALIALSAVGGIVAPIPSTRYLLLNRKEPEERKSHDRKPAADAHRHMRRKTRNRTLRDRGDDGLGVGEV